ncbi:helix-turn-helix domain-containing protein [Vandammella animalimorsus]|uniref:helix-turn-helix domain-containing protein n=1 Tax=Vandammella animalimorsus TaxID=2029117 RepID=UPI001177A379|nr:helix-turn-helix domain-containing protein [Vandammella animalimorsus]
MSISQTYQHLNAQERAVIMLSHGAGFSVRAMARTLKPVRLRQRDWELLHQKGIIVRQKLYDGCNIRSRE